MVDVFDGVGGVDAIVVSVPVTERRAGGSNNILMNVIFGVAVIINPGVVIKMVVAAKISSCTTLFDSLPKAVTVGRIIVEASGVPCFEGGFVAEEE